MVWKRPRIFPGIRESPVALWIDFRDYFSSPTHNSTELLQNYPLKSNHSVRVMTQTQGTPAGSLATSIFKFRVPDRWLHRYQQLREQLQVLDERRLQRQQRLDQLRHLKRLLEPFQDARKDIQPNLVTRDGELVQELEKMRMLAARVGGRLSQQKHKMRPDNASNADYLLPGSTARLEALLDTD